MSESGQGDFERNPAAAFGGSAFMRRPRAPEKRPRLLGARAGPAPPADRPAFPFLLDAFVSSITGPRVSE